MQANSTYEKGKKMKRIVIIAGIILSVVVSSLAFACQPPACTPPPPPLPNCTQNIGITATSTSYSGITTGVHGVGVGGTSNSIDISGHLGNKTAGVVGNTHAAADTVYSGSGKELGSSSGAVGAINLSIKPTGIAGEVGSAHAANVVAPHGTLNYSSAAGAGESNLGAWLNTPNLKGNAVAHAFDSAHDPLHAEGQSGGSVSITIPKPVLPH